MRRPKTTTASPECRITHVEMVLISDKLTGVGQLKETP